MKMTEEYNHDSDSTITIDDVQNLVKKKDSIEEQIKAYYDVLEDQGVGIEGPLVDGEVVIHVRMLMSTRFERQGTTSPVCRMTTKPSWWTLSRHYTDCTLQRKARQGARRGPGPG
ncbi:hypothetical protein SKAU_G00010560 [Synaphobranchus kaupii]|uniref:Nas2 N-terminal domain-containing protein n=1 Tax=Synaphobranchus kaupii TaxID=118154 RepID=A0A9Q1JC49_SYNKA|nr:hypothetical protein SKAU_G00010560 [Synaphobranchus kaupii]